MLIKKNEQLVATVLKIKIFFQFTPAKIDDVSKKLQFNTDDVEEVTRKIVERQREIEDATIDDVEVDQC